MPLFLFLYICLYTDKTSEVSDFYAYTRNIKLYSNAMSSSSWYNLKLYPTARKILLCKLDERVSCCPWTYRHSCREATIHIYIEKLERWRCRSQKKGKWIYTYFDGCCCSVSSLLLFNLARFCWMYMILHTSIDLRRKYVYRK